MTGPGEDAEANKAAAQDFIEDKIAGIVGKSDWAVLTAENPRGEQAPPEPNAAAVSQRDAHFEAVGATYELVRGKYGNEDESLAVNGISEEHAVALGKKYGHGRVLAPEVPA